ncbi:hypothetical protein PIB30_099591 [Stylosanthes scabra]|uniref:Uncharacterized protein n=1 Tax=Stylosanthes scabra TaxID=79078 RepID=A0ABU6RXT6_9FABA|nr:hypothetical protein [Stylosanthes scabra]
MEKATLVLLHQYMIEPMDGSSGSSLAISRLDDSMKLIDLAGRNDAGVDSPTDGEKKKTRRAVSSFVDPSTTAIQRIIRTYEVVFKAAEVSIQVFVPLKEVYL